MEKGVPIRSVSRSLNVLQAVNRCGAMSMMDIAQASRIPYPTACRIVQTLMHAGMIEREPGRKYYRPTALVQTLANGYQEHSQLVGTARPHIVEFTRKALWPVLVTTQVGNAMMVRDSTQSLTSLSFECYPPGHTFPLLECASGRVFMAYASDEHRLTILEGLREVDAGVDPHTFSLYESGYLTEEIRRDGFATRGYNRFAMTPGKTSSIAAPIMQDGEICGTLTMVFFAAAMKMQVAVERFAQMLVDTAADISADLSRPVDARFA
jgi:IclR family transcriptional regulator, mhp operon transcriptional activator